MHRFSRGILPLIDTICENSLIAGYSSKANQITPEIVREVEMDLCFGAASSSSTLESDDLEEVLGLLTQMIEPRGTTPPRGRPKISKRRQVQKTL